MNTKCRVAILYGLIIIIGMTGSLKTLGNFHEFSLGNQIMPNTDPAFLYEGTPQVNITTWNLRIDGFVQYPLNLTYNAIRALPAVTVSAPLICVERERPLTTGDWKGVQLGYILSLIEVKPEAIDMVFYAIDGFSSSLPVAEIIYRHDMLLTYEKNGKTLTPEEGYPIMIMAPGKWGYKWVKWVEHIELVDRDHRGYYESRGFSDVAEIPFYTPPQTAPKPPMIIRNTVMVQVTITLTKEETTFVPEFNIIGYSISLIFLGILVISYLKRR